MNKVIGYIEVGNLKSQMVKFGPIDTIKRKVLELNCVVGLCVHRKAKRVRRDL